jgi:hypothetical protein
VASGYWKTVTGYDENGKRVTRRVWVSTASNVNAEAAAAAAKKRALAKRRAANAARAAAARAAQRKAQVARERASAADRAAEQAARLQAKKLQTQRVLEARKAAFEALRKKNFEAFKSRALAADPVPKAPRTPAGPARDFQDERAQLQAAKLAARERAVRNEHAAVTQKRAVDAKNREDEARKRWLLMKLSGERDQRQMNDERGARGLDKVSVGLDDKDIRDIEKVLKAEADRSSGGQFDVETVEKLREAYDKHAEKTYTAYEDAVAKVNAALDKYKKSGSEADYNKAKRLYDAYLLTQKEFQRLFGNGKDPLKDGAYNEFQKNYQKIGEAQRQWWKSQMQTQLEKTLEGAQKATGGQMTPELRAAMEELAITEGKARTRQVVDSVDRFGNITYRNFTIEEEIAARHAEKIMQAEKMRAQYMKQQANIKAQMLREGYSEYKGQFVERSQIPVIKDAELTMETAYGGKFDPKRPNDIHTFVDKMLGTWEQKHPKPVSGGNRFVGREYQLALAEWNRQRKAYEDSAYKFFGLGSQGILEKGIDTPGIRHALQVLSVPFSALGAGARVANAAVFGSSKVGGNAPSILDAPAHVKAAAEAAAAAWMKSEGTKRGLNASRWDPRQGLEQAKQKYFEEWIQTTEGQIWWKRVTGQRQAQEFAENKDFIDSRATGKDFWESLEGFNSFGSSPFQNEGANLLASLLLDPLNVVPLKFTSYLARGKYAAELAGKVKTLAKPWTAFKSFNLVDEGTLSLMKKQKQLAKALTEKGMSEERFLDLLRERIVGISDKSARDIEIRRLMREIGIERSKINEAFLFNLAEHQLAEEAVKRGRSLLTEGDKLKASIDEADKASRAKRAAVDKAAKAEKQRVVESLRATEAKAKAARAAEGDAYRVAKAEAKSAPITKTASVSTSPKAGAARKVAGPSSPAKPIARAEVVRRAQAPLRQAYSDAIFAVRRGETPIDPSTGKRLAAASEGDAIAHLFERLGALDDELRAASGPAPRAGTGATIETKMAAGDVRGSQADNVREGVTRGGTLESGGATKPNGPPPEVTSLPPLAPAPIDTPDGLFERLGKMSEAEWYAHVKADMGAILSSKKSTPEAKATARKRLAQVKLAELAMEVEKKGGKYVSWQDRANFQKRALKLFGKDAEGYVAPKMVAPFVQSSRDALVEQARTFYTLLQRASPVELPGVEGIRILGDKVEFMPLDIFRELDRRMAAAISEARGHTADTVTRARGGLRSADDPDAIQALGRMTDRDPVVLKAKREALQKYFKDTGNYIPMAAYDEARAVLWRGHVQNRTAVRLLSLAKKKVAASGGDLEKVYLQLREEMARREARKQFGGMAFGSHFGVNPKVIFAEFVARYSDDGTIRNFQPELTGFQRRTLEANFAALSGKASNDPKVGEFLQSANRPPLKNRELTREFQKKTGAWSPRLSEDFVLGAKSWSIYDEASYWRDNFGEVPEWADVGKLATEFKDIFDDHQLYLSQMKEWGVFTRSDELAQRLSGASSKEIEDQALAGGRRSLELQRKFVIERYGRLVSEDGESLISMPWLMHPDEYLAYQARRIGESMPEGFTKTPQELAELQGMIKSISDRFWSKYITDSTDAVDVNDIVRLASEVQAQLLANPKWNRRYRDVFGTGLDAWSWFWRWTVFSNPSFMVVNVLDATLLKMPYHRFTRRGLYQRTLDNVRWAPDADGLTPQMFGLDDTPAIYRHKQMKARQRARNPIGYSPIERVLDSALNAVKATGEVFPEVSGKVELAMKMRMAKGMWPEVYDSMLKRFETPEFARVAALDFIKDEIERLWPTAGGGPIEQLWNRIAPFASYTVRNKLLWISEAMSNPVMLLRIDRIGQAIEEHNVREWEADPAHKGQPMPENMRRWISLPWAPDWRIDLSQFTDASRGLQPLTETSWKSNLDRLQDWVRVASPSTVAGIRALFNAYNLFPRTAWKPVLDANGFPTGRYELVTVPWAEPWSKDAATISSVLWFVDAIETGQKYGINGWDAGEVSAMIGQVFFFSAIKTYDKNSVLFGWYKGLSKADQAKFNETPEGKALAEWLLMKAGAPRDFKGDTLAAMQRYANDPQAWWHSTDPKWRARVTAARDKISRIEDAFMARLAQLTPGTAEYKELKGKMLLAISDVYSEYPELLQAEVYSKTPTAWAAQTERWQTNKLMDDFMALANNPPKRSDFATTAAYNKAREEWEHQKQVFLKTYPQVEKQLGTGVLEIDSVRAQMEKHWDTVLARISKRKEAMDSARAIIKEFGRDSAKGRAAQERLDILYLQNDLDYSLLERDYSAAYFSAEDRANMPKGVGPDDRQQSPLLRQVRTFLDFDRTGYEKARKNGTLDEYLAKAEYGQAMKAATLYAKGGDPFGKFDVGKWMAYMQKNPSLMEKYFGNNTAKRDEWAKTSRYIEGIRALWKRAGDDGGKWVRLLKQDPWLLNEYYRRNPEKRAEWQRMDSYIRHISVWGKLVGAGRWDEANDAWDRLPKWVQDEYHRKNPAKRKQSLETAQYLGYMKKWVSFFDANKSDEGMAYFNSLPKWARERYFKAHPENRLKFEENEQRDTWLREYFATDTQYRADYLAKHPEFKRWLAQNADTKELERVAILQAYRSIPSGETWLRRVFREKYPEIFSKEALGERKLKAVYDVLAKHGGIIPEFEKWVEEIWRTYAEMKRLGTPRPLGSYFERDREEERKRRLQSRSAAEVSG